MQSVSCVCCCPAQVLTTVPTIGFNVEKVRSSNNSSALQQQQQSITNTFGNSCKCSCTNKTHVFAQAAAASTHAVLTSSTGTITAEPLDEG